MSITDQVRRNQYSATGGQTIFTYTFWITDQDDIKVYKRSPSSPADDDNDILTIGVDYTVTGVNVKAGGTVILTSGATAGEIVTLDGTDEPLDRSTNINTGAEIKADDLNDEFDTDIRYAQDNKTKIDTRIPKYQTSATVLEDDLNLPELGASQFWQKNSTNTGIFAATLEDNGDVNTLRSELASQVEGADGALIVGYYDEATATGTTVHDKLDSSTLPALDTTSIVRDPVDQTKQMRIDVGNVSTATTRTLIIPDEDIDLGTQAAPISDNINLIKSNSDNTKQIATDAQFLTTATTRTLTFRDEDVDFRTDIAPIRTDKSIIKDSADETKLLNFDISAITTATTRTITFDDTDQNISPRIVRANLNAVQNIANATLTEVVFDNIDFQIGTGFDTVTGRYTPTVEGYYLVNSSIAYLSFSGGTTEVYVYKNGVVQSVSAVDSSAALAGGFYQSPCISDVLFLNGTTDYVSIFTRHDAGPAFNIETISYVSIQRILY